MIMKKLMTNRVAHADFDPILSDKSTREYLRGLVFQNSELQPYSRYMKPEIQKALIKEFKEGQGHFSSLPTELGANRKDFERAVWISKDLSMPPFYGEAAGGYSAEGADEAEDPDIVKEKKVAIEKIKAQEQFEERVIQIFDPNGLLQKETGRLDGEKQGVVYDIQVKHNSRIMEKA